MPYIYKDTPDWREKAAESFSDSFSKSLEAAILRKQKKQDEADALAKQIQLSGLQEMPVGSNSEDYDNITKIGDKTYGKPLSQYEKRKRAAELNNLEEGSPINYFDPVTQKLIQVGRATKGSQIIKGNASSVGELTPEAIQNNAEIFNLTGNIPSLGMGASKVRTDILNKAAELKKSKGQSSEDLAANRAQYKSDVASLQHLTSQRDNILSFEHNAGLNMDYALQLSSAVDRSGVPIFNKWKQAGQRAVTGNKELSQFDAAIRTAINEYAKVITSVTGSGQLSDTARKEVETLLSAAQTPEQFQSVIETMKVDMSNRRKAYDKQTAEILDRLKNTHNSVTQQVQQEKSIKPLTATNPTTGEKIQSLDGGQTWQPVQ